MEPIVAHSRLTGSKPLQVHASLDKSMIGSPEHDSRSANMEKTGSDDVLISQSVAILIDGNNIERSIHSETNKQNTMLNFDTLVPGPLMAGCPARVIYRWYKVVTVLFWTEPVSSLW